MKLLILGSGMMGRGVAFDFCHQEDVEQVVLADRDLSVAKKTASELESPKILAVEFSAHDERRLAELMEGCSVAVGATSYEHNTLYSKVAVESGCSFIDLGGSHTVVEKQFKLDSKAKDAGVALIPDCGLAPGLVNILSGQMVKMFDRADSIQIRVGGIPVNPRPPLNYQLVFSARGLINEYIEKCKIIRNGAVAEVDSMDGLEALHFEDPFGPMEAFYTSGGISTLTETMPGKVKDMDYKTIRYPGHQKYIRFLMELGFTGSEPLNVDGINIPPRRVLEKLLERNLTGNGGQDAILLRIIGNGEKTGKKVTYIREAIDFSDVERNHPAMMRMTAFPAAVIALMLARNEITDRGVLFQECSVPCKPFTEELKKRKINFSLQEKQA